MILQSNKFEDNINSLRSNHTSYGQKTYTHIIIWDNWHFEVHFDPHLDRISIFVIARQSLFDKFCQITHFMQLLHSSSKYLKM